MTNLKPCPFCGCENIIIDVSGLLSLMTILIKNTGIAVGATNARKNGI